MWGKQAETCGQYLAKGRQVYIEGSIRTRQYDDKDGNKRYITEVIAQRVQFLGGGGGDVRARRRRRRRRRGRAARRRCPRTTTSRSERVTLTSGPPRPC